MPVSKRPLSKSPFNTFLSCLFFQWFVKDNLGWRSLNEIKGVTQNGNGTFEKKKNHQNEDVANTQKSTHIANHFI